MLHIYHILQTSIPAVNRRQTKEKVGLMPHTCTHFLGEAPSHPEKADCQEHPRAAQSAKPHFSRLSSAADTRRTPLPLSIHLRERGGAHAAEVWRCAFTTTARINYTSVWCVCVCVCACVRACVCVCVCEREKRERERERESGNT